MVGRRFVRGADFEQLRLAEGRPRKSMLTGSSAAIGGKRLPLASRSYTWVVKPAGTVIAGKPRLLMLVHRPELRSFFVGSRGDVSISIDGGMFPVGYRTASSLLSAKHWNTVV